MTLEPGDLISTVASGVVEMHVGDTVTIEVEHVGRLTNRMVPW
jgi:2-keto-4-pentenoate hydratase/2-oxohepta-3-ene-1,7-dioic acid hydratase in catechol pathway